MATAERCGALILGIAGVSAGYLFLVSLSGWDPENRGFFSLFPIPGWLHGFLIVSAIVAFVVCIATMLFAVTVETRRINAIRASLERRRRRRLHSESSRNAKVGVSEPRDMSTPARPERGHELPAGLERGS